MAVSLAEVQFNGAQQVALISVTDPAITLKKSKTHSYYFGRDCSGILPSPLGYSWCKASFLLLSAPIDIYSSKEIPYERFYGTQVILISKEISKQ